MNSRCIALLVCLAAPLPSAAAADADLLTASKDAPMYRLSNFRTETDQFGNRVMLFDFTRTRKGANDLAVSVRGRSSRSHVTVSAFLFNSVDSGTMQLRSLFGRRGNQPLDLEIFLAQAHNWGDGKTRYAVVSNAVRLGNPGPTIEPRAWTAEEEKQYEAYRRMMADPNAHKPPKSYPVTIDVPEDAQFLPKDAKVTPGARLEACFQEKWHPLTTLSENKDGSVNVRWDDYGAQYDCSMSRDELIIKKAYLVEASAGGPLVALSQSEARKRGLLKDPPPAAKPLKSYPVSIAVPDDSQFVPDDATLQPGTKLQACYAGKWNPITHLAHNEDGTLTVRWDDYGPTYDCSMVRKELIIRKTVLKRLQEALAEPADPPSEPSEFRTWTDASGNFKVRARLLRKSDTTVTVVTDAGREMNVPISKLSEADQRFLHSTAAAPKAP